ncbi:short chain dehydrogenase [Duganella sp. BJB488]|uniref:short chain dehydrogenase n=1 Tax=unclassified Duganella TaxID=2636909 RepID=UPI000E34D63F|nr:MULTISPECIES: short chain dehydrogenase [unclassified Duganella]RFP26010.1 short chain dehydrogenase [Duganella sp. BJB489]RFP28249.1 short chain dehydrogenase [Duganella sp. BJB488]RFP36940.1 short chain dehydrogenase [Duganella sp. BJB480]
MKVMVIGGTGTIGGAVVEQLKLRHEVIVVGARGGQHQVDIEDIAQVRALFGKVGRVDAVVVAAGALHVGSLAELTPEHFHVGLRGKLMGQVNVALVAREFLNDGGSITLTSGVDTEQPIRGAVAASTANAAVQGFVRAAAIELPRGLRINAVSPTVLKESVHLFGELFTGFEPIAASRAALSYARSVDGAETGRVYRAW